jgi:hypothetical protein
MPDPFEYISRSRLEFKGGYRNASLGEVPEPVVLEARARRGL